MKGQHSHPAARQSGFTLLEILLASTLLAVLAKNGSGRLSRQQLEQLRTLSAQRISMLHEFDAPEFSDRTLFKQFIESLQDIKVLGRDDAGNLTFDRRLETFARDANTAYANATPLIVASLLYL